MPIGGFVNVGEDEEASDDPNHFVNKPIWQRVTILSAGVSMNVVLAAVLIIIGLIIGLPQVIDEDIDLSVDAYKIFNYKFARLTWSGATSASVDVYRDDSIIATTSNDGEYTHGPFTSATPATYQLCEAETSICSNSVTVSW